MDIPVETLAAAAAHYKNDAASHRRLYDAFGAAMENDPDLIRHRQHIEANSLGFGDRPFHWLWKLIVDALPLQFSFLEVGVYKGQVLSLIGLLAQRSGGGALTYGISPLDATADKFSSYDDVNYASVIDGLQEWSGIPASRRAHIIKGLSTDEEAKRICHGFAPFDAVYIDGGHDYDVVVNDIVSFGNMVTPGGYLIMDDASVLLDLPEGIWPGHADVSRAVDDVLRLDDRFSEIMAVGHLRVWRNTAQAPFTAQAPLTQ